MLCQNRIILMFIFSINAFDASGTKKVHPFQGAGAAKHPPIAFRKKCRIFLIPHRFDTSFPLQVMCQTIHTGMRFRFFDYFSWFSYLKKQCQKNLKSEIQARKRKSHLDLTSLGGSTLKNMSGPVTIQSKTRQAFTCV